MGGGGGHRMWTCCQTCKKNRVESTGIWQVQGNLNTGIFLSVINNFLYLNAFIQREENFSI